MEREERQRVRGGFGGGGAQRVARVDEEHLEFLVLIGRGRRAEVDALEQDRALAAPFGLGDAEAEGFFGRLGALDFFHALDLLQLALGLGGLRGDGAEAVGEFLERGDFLLLVFVTILIRLSIILPALKSSTPKLRLLFM